jgi:hypothetical protein
VGIDGSKDENFTKADWNDMEMQFGRSWSHTGPYRAGIHKAMDCDYSEPADQKIAGSRIGRGATENYKPRSPYDARMSGLPKDQRD